MTVRASNEAYAKGFPPTGATGPLDGTLLKNIDHMH